MSPLARLASPEGVVRALILVLLVGAAPRAARAEGRESLELSPVTVLAARDGTQAALFLLGYTIGLRAKTVVPYVGAALGLVTAQARAGVTWVPAGHEGSGFMARLDARPQLGLNKCVEPALVGSLGAGYRWSLEPSYEAHSPGTAFYLLPAFDAGYVWLRPTCGRPGAQQPLRSSFGVGGNVALGFDW